MKKAWKIILSIIIILIIGVAGTTYYLLNVKTYNIKDPKVEKITKGKYNIVLPELTQPGDKQTAGKSTANNGGKNSQQTASSGTDSKNNNTNSNSQNGQSSQAGQAAQTAAMTANSIINKYRPVFSSLESQANGRINALYGAAISEYESKKAKGESISYIYFYKKYTSAGYSLESQTDGAFNYVYSALQKDLKNNGFNPNSASSIKSSYQSEKKARESALLGKVKSAL